MPAHARAEQRRDDQRYGKAREQPGRRYAGVARDVVGQHGRQVVARRPGERLRRAQHDDRRQSALILGDPSAASRSATSSSRSLPQNGSPSTRMKGEPNTPLAIACSFSVTSLSFTSIPAGPRHTLAIEAQHGGSLDGNSGIGCAVAIDPVFLGSGLGEVRRLLRRARLDPVEGARRRQRMLREAAGTLSARPRAGRRAGHRSPGRSGASGDAPAATGQTL